MATAEQLLAYQGRQIDVLAYQTLERDGLQQPLPTLISPEYGSLITTGIQKLAQNVLLELLTVRGSVLFKPNAGTDFIRSIQNGSVRTELDLSAAFAVATTQIMVNLAETTDQDTPPDERLNNLELVSAVVQPGEVRILFSLTSDAGASRTLIAPIKVAL